MDEPLVIHDLIGGAWRDCAFAPFRAGVEICVLAEGEPTVALLRYAPGAAIPRHLHTGLEIIVVLDGAQSDERGTYRAGALVLNPEGTEHSVASDDGCVVLILWTRPVEFT